jgi:hypothetical protein
MHTHCWGVVALIVAIGCFNSETAKVPRQPSQRGKMSSPQTPLSTVSSNPFLAIGGANCGPCQSKDLSSCLTARLYINTLVEGRQLQGVLAIQNQCKYSVAILTAPIETRLRLSASDRFPAEVGIAQVYAVAYLFRREEGLPQGAFVGDGGVSVSIAPDYAVVEGLSEVSIPVTSGHALGLVPGAYGLALSTVATWAQGRRPHDGVFDLRNNIAAFTATRPQVGTIELPAGAIRLAAVGFFRVTKEPDGQ